MNIVDLVDKLRLDPKNIYNIYFYGSRVYGTFNELSDWDFIIVTDQIEDKIDSIESEDKTINATLYSIKGFQKEIDKHEISVLECLFLPSKFILKEDIKFNFTLDYQKLRHSISTKVSNSWVKAKKKLTVSQDYNPLIAKKSLFHVFRILSFGIQIAKDGIIYDYHKANHYWFELLRMENNWELWKITFQMRKKLLDSEFKKLAPKKI